MTAETLDPLLRQTVQSPKSPFPHGTPHAGRT